MKRIIAFLAGMLILIGPSCSPPVAAGPTPYAAQTACDHPFSPYRLGASWTAISQDNQEATSVVTEVSGDLASATAVLSIQNGETPVKQFVTCDSLGRQFTRIETTRDGVFAIIEYLSVTGALFGPVDLFVPGSEGEVVALTHRTVGIAEPIESTSVQTYSISGPETITVPAGTFNALKVVTVNTVTTVDGQVNVSNITVWFAYGIGQIKSATDFGVSSELVSFSMP